MLIAISIPAGTHSTSGYTTQNVYIGHTLIKTATLLEANCPEHLCANQHPQREPSPSPKIVCIHLDRGVLCTLLTTSSGVSGSISSGGVGSRALEIKPTIKKTIHPMVQPRTMKMAFFTFLRS